MVDLDPWGSEQVEDYSKLFEEFGIEEFRANKVPNPMDLMRRGIIFGHRDYDIVLDAMENNQDFAALSGFMPSGNLHIGHLMVMRELVWHQEMGADTYFVIADLEAHSARGMTWDEIDRYTEQYVESLIALGFDSDKGHIYRQSKNERLNDLQFELAEQTNFNEMNSIYGFQEDTNLGHIQSVLTQAADILFPQIDDPKPTVIPVGADQDPHLRLTRGLARRMRMFGVTEAYASFEIKADEKHIVSEALHEIGGKPKSKDVADYLEKETGFNPSQTLVKQLRSGGSEELFRRIRVFSRGAPESALEDLIDEVEKQFSLDEYRESSDTREYSAHIDINDPDESVSTQDVEEITRGVEVRHGGYGFYPPSSFYHRFMTGLTGGKMSSSEPKSHIAVTDTPEEGHSKVMSATTGGRETAELQRELGGEADECPVYELYAYMLARDDEHAKKVYDECVGGERLCGGCKSEAAELMSEFLEEHAEKRASAKKEISQGHLGALTD